MKTLWTVTIMAGATISCAADILPDQYLAAQPKPVFASGHHLPPLTMAAWPLSSNMNVQMAQNWGYCLDLGLCDTNLATLASTPGTFWYGLAQRAITDPTHFKASCQVWKSIPDPIPDGFYVTNAGGAFVDIDGQHQISPEGTPSYWASIASWEATPIAALQAIVPLTIIQNIGEYGLLEPTPAQIAVWQQDPRVTFTESGTNYWYWYASNAKSNQMIQISTAVRNAVPSRRLYAWYKTNAESRREMPNYTGGEWITSFDFSSIYMNATTDLPGYESYYQGGPGSSWTGAYDLLTMFLNSVAFNLNHGGSSTNYSWVSGGWGTTPSALSPIGLYTGFLKCAYTAGMIGGVSGYFDYPSGGFDAPFDPANPPHWLLQIEAHSRVQGLFSNLERYLLSGTLLPGPSMHALSTDEPAYEFQAGTSKRVLSRKLNSSNDWLVTAWAADGTNAAVSVTIPTLGAINLTATSTGNVYRATASGVQLLDMEGNPQVSSTLRNVRLKNAILR